MKKRLLCFNVNGIRARLSQLEAVVEVHEPEIIGLQETKVHDDEFPVDEIHSLGYGVDYFGQKGHYGVALLSKIPPIKIVKGFPTDGTEAQRRIIHGCYRYNNQDLHVINGYFPQGENRAHPIKFPAKKKFYDDLYRYMVSNFTAEDRIVVMGDMNVAMQDEDVGITPENAKRWLSTGKTSFLPEEREWLQRLIDWGLIDSYRAIHGPDSRVYSWYDYRSRGFEQEPKRGLRIDLILTSKTLSAEIITSDIDVQARGHEKPSDHCPIWIDLDSAINQ